MLAEFRRVVVADLEALECDQSKEVERVKELAQRSRKQSESKMEVLRGRLDVEQEKLEDCHREIEIYRQQLEGARRSLSSSHGKALSTLTQQRQPWASRGDSF